jgi:hypothetical protein
LVFLPEPFTLRLFRLFNLCLASDRRALLSSSRQASARENLMSQFTFSPAQGFPGLRGVLPYVPLTLTYETQSLTELALVDSGAAINVLPYEFGLELGLSWEWQDVPLPFIGILKGMPAFGIVLSGQAADFEPVRLAFAWTRRTRAEISLILGMTNFFDYFRLVLDKPEGFFELIPKD